MDAKAVVSTILSDESVKSISKKTGASQRDISSVLSAALPLLLAGANNQAQNQDTAESFTNALVQHSANDTSDVGSFFGKVDLSDGAKIVAHLLGANTQSNAQTQTIAQQSGVNSADTGNILAAAAPLLMSLLGQQTNVQSNNNSSAIGSLMGSLLGSLLSDNDQQSNSNSSGIDLGDVVSLLGKLLK